MNLLRRRPPLTLDELRGRMHARMKAAVDDFDRPSWMAPVLHYAGPVVAVAVGVAALAVAVLVVGQVAS